MKKAASKRGRRRSSGIKKPCRSHETRSGALAQPPHAVHKASAVATAAAAAISEPMVLLSASLPTLLRSQRCTVTLGVGGRWRRRGASKAAATAWVGGWWCFSSIGAWCGGATSASTSLHTGTLAAATFSHRHSIIEATPSEDLAATVACVVLMVTHSSARLAQGHSTKLKCSETTTGVVEGATSVVVVSITVKRLQEGSLIQMQFRRLLE